MKLEEKIGEGLTRVWDIERVIFHHETVYQDVLIAKTSHGITLFCNNERQSSELSQLLYHEGMTIPALMACPEAKSALVIGSSEGVASQILLKAGLEYVCHVDIDRKCVEACAEHLPYGYCKPELLSAICSRTQLLQFPNAQGLNVVFQDGKDFIDRCKRKFDIIVMDLPDEELSCMSPHNELYNPIYTQKILDLLTKTGCLITQAGCPTLWRNATLVRAWERAQELVREPIYWESSEHEWSWLVLQPSCGVYPALLGREHLRNAWNKLKYRPKAIRFQQFLKGYYLPSCLEFGE